MSAADSVGSGSPENLAFLAGGGEMGAFIRAHCWGSSPLGSPASWPQGLKTAVRLLLSTQHPMFIWWGPELIQFYNDAYRRSIGPERHPSALGQRGRECWAEIWDIIGWQVEQVMSGGSATWQENQLVPITRHGQLEDVYWTYSYSPIDESTAPNGIGGVLVVCTETTEQVLSKQRLSAAEARWRTLFDQAPGFMAILRGPEHLFEYANARYTELIGGRNVIGKPLREALPEIRGQGFINLLNRLYRTGEHHIGFATPVTIERVRREVRYLDFIYQPLRDEQGAIIGILVHGFDVTERVLAGQALEAADQRKNEFLAMLAHELRNPLAPIHNASEFLRRTGGGDARYAPLIDIIHRQTTHLRRLVDDLLDVSRITQGRIELKTEAIELSSVVRQALETTQQQLDAKELRLSLRQPEAPLFVRADRARIIQCVSNVLTNSAKYTDRGGMIGVEIRHLGEWAEVEIADTGIGISPELLPRIFDIFVQGDRALDRSQGGLGIGLAVVKQLMTLHGGEVRAFSEGPGRGATFCLRIPAMAVAEDVQQVPAAHPVAPRRVLVVDDNHDSAESLAMLLRLDGNTVELAASGEDALRLAGRVPFDIVLLDIGLPQMDGYEVARRLRANGAQARLVALTGYGREEDRRRALDAGFEAHLVKPVDFAALGTLLRPRA